MTSSAQTPKVSRRRYERLPLTGCAVEVSRPLLFGLLRKPMRCEAAGLDLSEVGMRLMLPERVALGEKLRLVARIETFNDVIEGECSVVWFASNTGKADQFVAGVEWTRLAPGHFARIQRMRRVLQSKEFRQIVETRKRKAEGRAEST